MTTPARSNPAVLRGSWVALLLLASACSSDPAAAGPADLATRPVFPGDAAPEGCSDGVQNGAETAIDCGGPACSACAAGSGCAEDRDCQSALCLLGTCAAGPTCNDGRVDGKESDTDCGGSDCGPCAPGRHCRKDADCTTQVCLAGTCAPKLGLAFAVVAETATLPRDCWGLVSGDFDGDQRLDAAVASYADGSIQPFFGRGDGTFVAGGATPAATGINMLAAADFDSDGRDDLVGAHRASTGATLYLAGPQRTLRAGNDVVMGRVEVIAVGDWNGDRRSDLVAGSQQGFSLYAGDGKGGFAPPASGIVGNGAYSPSDVTVGDTDGDGRPEMFVINSQVATLVTGAPTNGFWVVRFSVGSPSHPGATSSFGLGAFGDFDHDGVMDLAAWAGWPSVYVFRGDGTMGFLGGVETPNAPQNPLMRMRVADFDRDGHDDLAIAGPNGSSIVIWRGIEAGQLVPALSLASPYTLRNLATGDFDADGKPDIIATVDSGQGTHELALFLNRSK